MTDNKFQIQVFAAGEIVPALQALDGVDFTRQWVGRMIDHQEGGAAFASTMLAQLPDPRVAQLAQSLASRLPQQALELRALQ